MKAKSSKLVKFVSLGTEKRGYTYFKDSITGADVLFIKQLGNSLFLSLGITASNYYSARFTASFYLSKSTCWSSVWGDMPKDSYVRIGRFLNPSEREEYLDAEFCEEGVVDSWWRIDEKGVGDFFSVLDIAEARLLAQKDLLQKIDDSKDVNALAKLSSFVLDTVDEEEDYNFEYKYIPVENVDDVPIKWFKASETAIKSSHEILNKNTVLILGSDAWRQWVLSKKSLKPYID